MNVVSVERRKGIAVKLEYNCIESMRHVRNVLKYYNDNCPCVPTNDGFRRCLRKIERTKIQAKAIN
jgi:hypothetical protein